MNATEGHKVVSIPSEIASLRPRDRILAVARDLFHRHGIRAVGVETIAEAAGTNKMTLYRHFPSKDELVAECLRGWSQEALADWDRLAERLPGDPRGQLMAWLDHASAHDGSANRGCAIANAAVELPDHDHPARRVIEADRCAQRQQVVRLCTEAGLAEPEMLADTLFLMIEGARVSLQSVGDEGPGARLLPLARNLIDAHAR